MAFAVIHPEAGRVDLTLSDLGCGLSWAAVYKVRPRVALCCPDCGYGVHAKVSARKLRYFAHDPGRSADCAWLNESLEHHLLKLELATAVRAADWHAELRSAPRTGVGGPMCSRPPTTAPDASPGKRKLSPITGDDIRERTERYQHEGIGVCWVSPADGALPWMGAVPSIRVCDPREGRPWTVVDGVAGFSYRHGTWIAGDDVELTAFVRWVLVGQTTPHQVLPRYRRVWFSAAESYRRRQMIWTTQRSVGEEARHEAMRQRQETWRREQQEKEQQAEQRRKEEAARQREIQRLQEEREREIRQTAERARWEE